MVLPFSLRSSRFLWCACRAFTIPTSICACRWRPNEGITRGRPVWTSCWQETNQCTIPTRSPTWKQGGRCGASRRRGSIRRRGCGRHICCHICIIIFYIRIQINYMKKLFLAVLIILVNNNNNNSTILITPLLFLLLCLYYSFHKFVNQPDVFVLYRYVPSSGLFMLCAYLKTDVIIYYRWNVSLSLFKLCSYII